MSDFLLELSKNPNARKLISSLGLPVPMPQPLSRAKGPQSERPLADLAVAVHSGPDSGVLGALAHTLAHGGANPYVAGDIQAQFTAPGEAYGRLPRSLDLSGEQRFGGLVLDATEIDSPDGLGALYDFLHPLIGRLDRCGRVVVIGRPSREAKTAGRAAAQRSLEGFIKSVAKEIGKHGATAQLVVVKPGAEAHLAGPLRFILSSRSAYVTGQPLVVDGSAGAALALRDLEWTAPLEGKVALVTGAARGIGAATARQLAADGAKVVLLDRPADDGPTSKLAQEIGGEVLLLDVTDPEAPSRISAYFHEKHGGVDIIVHNAGVTRDKTLKRMKRELWDLTLGVNLKAVNEITDKLILEGTLKKNGRIICLSSIAGLAGNMGQTNYSASKAGVIGLVQFYAGQLAKDGVTVNGIAPGFIETRLTDAIPVAIREVGRRLNNLSQGGRPDDVAQAISFLAHPASQGMNGQILRVCGGSLVGA